MHWLFNLPSALWRRLMLLFQGVAALLWLIARGIGALFGRGGTIGSRLGAAIASPAGQRQVFALLRLFQPNLVLKRRIIAAYPNNGITAIATRRADVVDILGRDADFGVVYAPRMEKITAGENFFLGMQDSPRYTRDTSNMRLVVRRDDVPSIVTPYVANAAAEIVAMVPGVIDVPKALTQPVAAGLLDRYFGTPGPSEAAIAEWTTLLFWYLFIDLQADPALDARAEAAAAALRSWMDGHIAERRSQPHRDDVLGRCLAMGDAAMPGMRDLDIRNNLIGLMIGELPTLSAAANLALDELLDRPGPFAAACAAARDGDDATLSAHIFEALRFRPLNPVIYRRAMHDTAIASGKLRRRRIAKDSIVMASNLSAMFDPLAIPDAASFRVDRPWESYMLWGHGMHSCFGGHINRAVLPALLKPLLAQPNLRRAAGVRGRIDQAGTPFPQHLHLEFDS
ncbi:cytochrome P450 [Sphingomonas sp. HT-1]|uniref:cytochrome P450 n=1 Tax=unclassified Sphingomonas TaxID=196159 RepID=UPI000300E463|nr:MULTISPECIES: cytochrome P450 [unclassified Sphingomonas]KTF68511.1 cytochrome [Sphingomonas sp. WG]